MQKEVKVVFCDKAFDRVGHKGLIFKLQTSGIDGDLLDWFLNLSERSQSVVIDGHSSQWGLLKPGVPQSSVIGPLIFLYLY